MAFNWIQSKLKKGQKQKEPVPVVAHKATKTIFGPTPWTIWFDSGLEIVCEEGRDEGRTIPLEYAFQVVGRGISTEEFRAGWLLFIEETVSRRQAVLCWSQEKESFYLLHLKGATNGTYVDRRAGEQWRIGVGSTVEMGYLRYRIQRRLPSWKVSPFVSNTLDRMGLATEDIPVRAGWALTVIDGERKGNTFILSRRFHVVYRSNNGDALLQRGQAFELEQALLLWNDEAEAYMLLHNPQAEVPTCVHAARPTQNFEVFGPVPESSIEVVSDNPLVLREGDTVRIGHLHLRLHRHIQPLLEGTINHIMQKGYIEHIPSVDTLLRDLPTHAGPQPEHAPVLVPDVVEEDDEDTLGVEEPGWVNPDLADEYRDKLPPVPAPSVPDSPYAAAARRVPRVAPGHASATSAEVEAPRRKARSSPPPRVAPSDEPLPFDPGETTLPRPAVSQATADPIPARVPRRGARNASSDSHPVAERSAGDTTVSQSTPPVSHAAPFREDEVETTVVPVVKRVAVAPPPSPPAPASPMPARVGSGEQRRLSLDVAPSAPASRRRPTEPAASARPDEGDPLEAFELVVVTVPGQTAGTNLTVAGQTTVDVSDDLRIVIGNAEGSDLRLPGDAALAASHAVIEATDRGLALRPLEGMPMVNRSICVKETLLRDGDEIKLTRNSVVRFKVAR